MLKKVFVIIMLLCSLAFAENYIVTAVVGKAETLRNGIWYQIIEDDVLSNSSVVNIGPNSSVVMTTNGKNYILHANSKGKVSECIIRSSIRFGTKAVISIGSNKKTNDTKIGLLQK